MRLLDSITRQLAMFAILLGSAGATVADDLPAPPKDEPMGTADTGEGETGGEAEEPGGEEGESGSVVDSASKAAADVAKSVDDSETAKEASAGLLQAIYDLAEAMSFSWFHWIAFAVMATGVVSFALQLVLGKLIVLTKGGFSLTAILADALGLVVSLVGLVLTTQAAAENSNFTTSPAAVLSAAVTGVLAGLLFYIWGQRQEIEAARGRSKK